MWLRFLVISSFCLINTLYVYAHKQDRQAVSVSLLPSSDDSFSVLDGCLEQPLMVKKLLFSADVCFSQVEFTYLTGIDQGVVLTLQELKKACWYLKRKNKFDTLDIVLHKTVGGVILIVALKAVWTFSRVSIKGSLTGKERYCQYYTLEPGELFDSTKHQHALVKVQQELHNNGYIQAQVTDQLIYHKDTKTVSVVLHVEQAHVFTILQANVRVCLPDKNTIADLRALEHKLQRRCQSLIGQKYNYYALEKQKECIHAYVTRKGFFNAQVTLTLTHDRQARTTAVVYTVEVHQQKRFVFFGNHFFSTADLLSELADLGASALFIPPALCAEDIASVYYKKGFWHTKVEWREEPERFFFLINEGPRSSIQLVTLRNAPPLATISPDALIQKTCAELYAAQYFDEDLLQKALESIIQEYIRQGFWDATFVHQEFVPLEQAQCYELVLTLEPGMQRYIKNIIIEQFPELIKHELFAAYATGQARPFDYVLLDEQRRWLIAYVRAQGLYYAQVNYILEDHAGGIVVRWRITAHNAPVYFGKTVLSGSSKIPPELILRELCYKEGDVFAKEKIEQTLKRLKNLAIFQSVSLVPYHRGYPEHYKTMVLTCVEDDPFEVRVRLGLQKNNKNFLTWSGTTYKLGGIFLWKNPRSKADSISLEGDITRFTRDVRIGYQVPWVYNYPLRTSVQLYSTRYQQPLVQGCHDILYNEAHDGVILQVDKYFDAWQAHGATGFEFFALTDLSKKLARVILFDSALVNKRVPVGFIEGSLVREAYSTTLCPTRGSFTLLSARLFMCLQNYKDSFLKLLFEQTLITPLYRSVIGALRIKYGVIFNRKFSMVTPSERFYLGGPTSLRGYDYTLVPPLTLFVDSGGARWWVPIGGKSVIDVTAELRFPLYQALHGSLFTDMGVLGTHKNALFNLRNMVISSGIGLCYETPVGPLRFDLGFKWHKFCKEEKRYAWFLTFGQLF